MAKQPPTQSMQYKGVSPSQSKAALVSFQTKVLFKGWLANDYTDDFVEQVMRVLALYPDAVIKRVTEPESGLQLTCKFVPKIAEVKEACDKALDEANRLQRAAAASLRNPQRRPDPRPRAENFANVLVRPDRPRYQEMVERSKRKGIDKREFLFVNGGILVTLRWLTEARELYVGGRKRMTGIELGRAFGGDA